MGLTCNRTDHKFLLILYHLEWHIRIQKKWLIELENIIKSIYLLDWDIQRFKHASLMLEIESFEQFACLWLFK